jgi:hypothetical protein
LLIIKPKFKASVPVIADLVGITDYRARVERAMSIQASKTIFNILPFHKI